MNKTLKVVLTSIALLVAVIVIPTWYGLGNCYHYVSNASNDLHIIKNGKIVVASAMIDFDLSGGYIAGLRLPSQKFECDNGGSLRIVMENKRRYFILSKDSGELLNFDSDDDFNAKLVALGIKDGIELDYSRFDKIWDSYSKFYANIDFDTCRVLD